MVTKFVSTIKIENFIKNTFENDFVPSIVGPDDLYELAGVAADVEVLPLAGVARLYQGQVLS